MPVTAFARPIVLAACLGIAALLARAINRNLT